jgi:hypothetical protein
MRKLSIIIMSLVVMSSCSTTKEAKTSRAEIRNEKKLVEQSMVKNAVETRRYIIKLDRLYFNHGGIASLLPRANFIIIDGDKAIISTAYLGRQYDIKPIAGINMRGRAVDYALTNNTSKGSYDIKVTVRNGRTASFDLYINVSKNGYCNASVSSLKIDNIRYSGYLVPISDRINTPRQEGDPI